MLFLIETHHKVLGDISPLLHALLKDSSIVHTKATSGDPYAGIAVLVNKNLEVLSYSEIIPGRLLNLRVKGSKKIYNISTIYGYTNQNATQEKMSHITSELTKLHCTSDNNIILGDFNFVDNDLDRSNHTRTGKNQTDNTLSKIWSDFTSSLDLSDPFVLETTGKELFRIFILKIILRVESTGFTSMTKTVSTSYTTPTFTRSSDGLIELLNSL